MMATQDRRARERAETEERILAVASRLLAEHGYEALTLRRLAAELEYTPAALYNHFKDKDEIVRAVCRQAFDGLAAGMGTMPPVADPVARLLLIGRAYIRFGAAHPHHYRLVFMTPPAVRLSDEEIEARVNDPHLNGYALLVQITSEAIAEGAFIPRYQDIDLAAQTLWAGVHGVTALEVAMASEDAIGWASLDDRIEAMTQALVRGMVVAGRFEQALLALAEVGGAAPRGARGTRGPRTEGR